MLKRKKKIDKTPSANGNGNGTKRNGAYDKHEMDTRIDYVEGLFASFLRYNQVVRAVVEKYGVTPKTAENYIYKAYERWKAEEAEERPLKKRRAMERIREIGMRALNEKDYAASLRAAELLGKMEGVDPGVNVNVKQSGTVEIETGDKLTEAVVKIMSKHETMVEFIRELNDEGEADTVPNGKRTKRKS